MRKTLLEVNGLRLENDGCRCAERKLALNVSHFEIKEADLIFILGDRKHGKTALCDSFDAIVEHSREGCLVGDQCVRQLSKPDKPDIHIDRLFCAEDVLFRRQGGNPEELRNENDSGTIFYCDDPRLPNKHDCSGKQILDIARERSLTLLLCVDPEHLTETFGYFLTIPNGAVIWLDEGEIFWSGDVMGFLADAEGILEAYEKENPNAPNLFLANLRASLTLH